MPNLTYQPPNNRLDSSAPTGIDQNMEQYFNPIPYHPKILDQWCGQIATAAITLGEATASTTDRGALPYSELATEQLIVEKADQMQQDQETLARSHIASHKSTSTLFGGTVADPSKAAAARKTLPAGVINHLDPDSEVLYFKNQAEIEALESKGVLDRYEKDLLKSLHTKQRRLIRRRSSSRTLGQGRDYFRSHRDKASRQGLKNSGASEITTAATLGSKGRGGTIAKVFHVGTSDEKLDRWQQEQEDIRNLVGAKGTVIWYPDGASGRIRKHVVTDVISTPAQAYRIASFDPKGEPVFETSPSGGPLLEPMYEPDLDGKGKLQYTYDLAGRRVVKVKPTPIPRDDRHYSGASKDSGKSTRNFIYYFADGTEVNSKAWSEDSFSPKDDIVQMRPLYTAVEAYLALRKGPDVLTELTLERKDLTLKSLVEHVSRTAIRSRRGKVNHYSGILNDFKRIQTLENELVYLPPDSRTSLQPDLRPKYDRLNDTGYFGKYYSLDPKTQRQTLAQAYALARAEAQIKDLRKKGDKARLEATQ